MNNIELDIGRSEPLIIYPALVPLFVRAISKSAVQDERLRRAVKIHERDQGYSYE